MSVSSTTLVGEILALENVSGQTGVFPVLKESFGESDAGRIIALAYYQLCRGKALSAAGEWFDARGSGNLGLSSQRVSELLERLNPDKINTLPAPSHIAWQKELIAEHRDSLARPDHLLEENESLIYGKTVYRRTGHDRTWYHTYFDPARKDKVIASFMQKLRGLKDELGNGKKPVESHKALYDRYFIIKETPVRGRKVIYNNHAIREFINNDSCHWVLVSTSAKTTRERLEEYRERNGVELYFDDEKDLLDLRRLKNHNERTINGKVFVTFISLIILAALRKKVNGVDRKKRKYWSEHDMLRKVETYAKVHFEGKHKDAHTTPTSAQRLVFEIFGIPCTFKGTDKVIETDDQ